MKEQTDSARWSRVCNICGIDGKQSLTDKQALNYYICFKDMDVNDMKVIKKEAYIVDKLTNDSTEINIQELKYAQISNSPLILAYVFSIDYEGHKYIIHQLYDIRSWSEKRAGKPNKTTGCYQIK
ncbi:MAG: hypothetical protein IJ081_00185 [Prevotella sp.]|nr:hypothetical protein [Prevotella sp.]